jgi:hypothetical protein
MSLTFQKISAENIVETINKHFVTDSEKSIIDNMDIITSVAGKTGVVHLDPSDITGLVETYAPLNSPILSGVPTIINKGKIISESDALNGGYF